MRFGVTNPVHPVSRPAFSKVLTRHQVVDQRLGHLRGVVRLFVALRPFGDFADVGGQSDQRQVEPANESPRWGWRSRFKLILEKSLANEAIDRMTIAWRYDRFHDGLKAPPLFASLQRGFPRGRAGDFVR